MDTTQPASEFLDELAVRGLIHDSTDRADLLEILERPTTCYAGFDPTADSLHIGHLLGIASLTRFARAGHRPLALVGSVTGAIGDPSGRSTERNLLDPATIAANTQAVAMQLNRLAGCAVVDNATWTTDLDVVSFLRDVGKHFSVNVMLTRDSVASRLKSGISFTEFAYQLLQANDFAELFHREGCRLQLGGSDQWGNIVAGIELIRRTTGERAAGLTWPLLTRSDGSKFGKSSDGDTIWLSAERTSPFQFHQHWLRVEDNDVEALLARLTALDLGAIAETMTTHRANPKARVAQRRLADELTAWVHSFGACQLASQAAAVLFGDAFPDADTLASLAGEIPTVEVPSSALTEGLVALVARSEAASSKNDARRLLAGGAVSLNGQQVGLDHELSAADLVGDRFILVRRGKHEHRLVIVS